MDDIRLMLGKYWVPSREPLVSHIRQEAICRAMSLGLDIVSDNTNLNRKVLKSLSDVAIFNEYELEYKDFFDTPLSVCIERDKNRDVQVSEKIIRNFYNNYKDIYPLNGR